MGEGREVMLIPSEAAKVYHPRRCGSVTRSLPGGLGAVVITEQAAVAAGLTECASCQRLNRAD